MRILVLGGTGVISRGIVNALLNENHEVSVFNRGKRNVSFNGEVHEIVGDRQNREAFESSMKKERFDVVIDMICLHPDDAASTLRAFGENTEQIIVTSSVAAYKRPHKSLPVVEEKEELTDDVRWSYGFYKAEMERLLQKAIAEKRMNVTIIRPSLTFGPGGANLGVFRQNYGVADRIRKGKPLVVFGDGTAPFSFTFVPDLARGYAAVAGNKKTYGETYHICNEDRHIWEDLYLEFGRILGREPDIVHIPSEILFHGAPHLFDHIFFEKKYAGIFDNSKIRTAVPGYRASISLNEGVRMMLEWYEAEANQVDPEKDALEDRISALHAEWIRQVANLA
jgi:nucleoside-diphosphate-sugar epimerase